MRDCARPSYPEVGVQTVAYSYLATCFPIRAACRARAAGTCPTRGPNTHAPIHPRGATDLRSKGRDCRP
eukprot:4511869-Alexandrium_andersonii.AAC.1